LINNNKYNRYLSIISISKFSDNLNLNLFL
jgi:hypothetical protein